MKETERKSLVVFIILDCNWSFGRFGGQSKRQFGCGHSSICLIGRAGVCHSMAGVHSRV